MRIVLPSCSSMAVIGDGRQGRTSPAQSRAVSRSTGHSTPQAGGHLKQQGSYMVQKCRRLNFPLRRLSLRHLQRGPSKRDNRQPIATGNDLFRSKTPRCNVMSWSHAIRDQTCPRAFKTWPQSCLTEGKEKTPRFTTRGVSLHF